MAADENLAAADNGSPGEKKNYLSDFFFMIITTSYCNSNWDLWTRWANQIILVFRQSNSPVISRNITSLEQEL